MKVVTNIEGLPELLRTMEQLPKATNKAALTKVLKIAGEPVAASAKSMAPRDEGALQSSIGVSTKLTRRHARGAKQNQAEVHIGAGQVKGVLNYATFVEFGTVSMPARPFMRPAWDTGKWKALKTIERETWNVVSKAAARYAKRQAKLRG